MICSKTNSKAKLEDCPVSWGGDNISVCTKCRMSIWDFDFDDFHAEDIMDQDDSNHFFN